MGVLLRGSRNETTLGISIRKELNTELKMYATSRRAEQVLRGHR